MLLVLLVVCGCLKLGQLSDVPVRLGKLSPRNIMQHRKALCDTDMPFLPFPDRHESGEVAPCLAAIFVTRDLPREA